MERFPLTPARSRKDKQTNEKKEEVEFHNVVAFNKTAELIHQYVHKGDQILIQGRLQTRSWEKDGAKHYKTEIVCESMQFGQKSKNSAERAPAPQEDQPAPAEDGEEIPF